MVSSSESEEERLSPGNESDVSMEDTPILGVPVEQEENPFVEETMEDSGFQNDSNYGSAPIITQLAPTPSAEKPVYLKNQ